METKYNLEKINTSLLVELNLNLIKSYKEIISENKKEVETEKIILENCQFESTKEQKKNYIKWLEGRISGHETTIETIERILKTCGI